MLIASRVQRWVAEGLIDKATGKRILDFEKSRGGLNFVNGLLGIGMFAILLGIAAIISVNWTEIPPYVKLVSHMIVLIGAAGALFWCLENGKKGIATELLAGALAGLTLTFIILTGQIYQSQEPSWKALTLWLILVTPFLFALTQSRFLIGAWIVAFIGTYVLFLLDMESLSHLTRTLCVTLMPFAMIAVGQNALLRRGNELWGIEISYTGFFLIALLASGNQIGWRGDIHTVIDKTILWQSFAITLLAAFILIGWRRARLMVPMPKVVDVFLPLSVAVGFLPLVTTHGNLPVLGAAVVIIYLAFCGWVGMEAGFPKAMNLAVTLIALRLFGVYIEVFGTLLKTGLGLIASGVLLILLVIGTKRVIASLPKPARRKTR